MIFSKENIVPEYDIFRTKYNARKAENMILEKNIISELNNL